jgi:NAD-dependent dihydropyrimidine dehydrogenase PreA subunit
LRLIIILKIAIDEDKCTGCGECREVCPKGFKIWEINKVAHVSNLEYCHVCTICASKCPEEAIKVIRNAPDDESDE